MHVSIAIADHVTQNLRSESHRTFQSDPLKVGTPSTSVSQLSSAHHRHLSVRESAGPDDDGEIGLKRYLIGQEPNISTTRHPRKRALSAEYGHWWRKNRQATGTISKVVDVRATACPGGPALSETTTGTREPPPAADRARVVLDDISSLLSSKVTAPFFPVPLRQLLEV